MNDPDRWPTFDRFDDDAIFADIVAHLNDDVPDVPDDADARRRAQPTADATPENEADGATAKATDPAKDDATDGSTDKAADEQADDMDRWPIHQPAVLPQPDDPQVVPAPQVWRAHEVEEHEEHFEPPPTTPLPVGDLQFWGIIAGMGGGPLVLLYLVFFNRDAGSSWILAAIAMSVGGFALLVSRIPGHHEDDDDGARL